MKETQEKQLIQDKLNSMECKVKSTEDEIKSMEDKIKSIEGKNQYQISN